MGKQPYIPLYIGDWTKDTNTISLEAEGALLKLIFKLWDSPTRGVDEFSLDQLSVLLKKGQEMTEKILRELDKNKVLDIEFLPSESVKIKSRRMLKDLAKSKSASERGKKGVAAKKQKNLAEQIPQFSLSKTQANSDNDSDNDIEIEIKENSVTVTQNLVDIFFNDLPNSTHFETISRNLFLSPEKLKSYIPAFRKKAELTYPSFDRFANHFKNWVAIELRSQTSPVKKRNQL